MVSIKAGQHRRWKRLAIALVGIFLICHPAFATLPVATTWEIRTAGNANNGGCYVTGSSGTDFSQQDAAQYSFTDLVLVTTTTASSASHTFDATDIGNCLHITAGTGFTQGWYQIVSQAAGVATLDRAAGTMGSTGGTFAVGGALVLPNAPCAVLTSGNTIYVKGGTFTVTTSCTLAGSTTANTGTTFIGYTTTRTDNGLATWTTATNSIALVLHTGNIAGLNFKNFTFTNTAGTRAVGIGNSGNIQMSGLTVQNCFFDGFTSAISERQPANIFLNHVEVKNSTVGPAVAIGFANVGGNSGATLYDTWIHNNTGIGVSLSTAGGMLNVIASTIANNTTDGVQVAAQTGETANLVAWIINSNLTGNGSDGFESTAAGIELNIGVINSTIYGNTSFGIKNAVTPSYQLSLNNGFGANGTNRQNFSAGAADITLTADPFTNSAGGDYSLNSTAGGGAALRNAGFPGASLFGTGFIDVGPLQHQVVPARVVYGSSN